MNSWEKFNKENEMYAVGQQADLHTKKKGSSKKSKEENTPLRNQVAALQEQNAAAMLREVEYRAVLKDCYEFAKVIATKKEGWAAQRALGMCEKLEAVL